MKRNIAFYECHYCDAPTGDHLIDGTPEEYLYEDYEYNGRQVYCVEGYAECPMCRDEE